MDRQYNLNLKKTPGTSSNTGLKTSNLNIKPLHQRTDNALHDSDRSGNVSQIASRISRLSPTPVAQTSRTNIVLQRRNACEKNDSDAKLSDSKSTTETSPASSQKELCGRGRVATSPFRQGFQETPKSSYRAASSEVTKVARATSNETQNVTYGERASAPRVSNRDQYAGSKSPREINLISQKQGEQLPTSRAGNKDTPGVSKDTNESSKSLQSERRSPSKTLYRSEPLVSKFTSEEKSDLKKSDNKTSRPSPKGLPQNFPYPVPGVRDLCTYSSPSSKESSPAPALVSTSASTPKTVTTLPPSIPSTPQKDSASTKGDTPVKIRPSNKRRAKRNKRGRSDGFVLGLDLASSDEEGRADPPPGAMIRKGSSLDPESLNFIFWLRNPSVQNLALLRKSIRCNDHDWMQGFLDFDGLGLLFQV